MSPVVLVTSRSFAFKLQYIALRSRCRGMSARQSPPPLTPGQGDSTARARPAFPAPRQHLPGRGPGSPRRRPGPGQPPVTRGSRLRINFCMWAAASMMAGAGGGGRGGRFVYLQPEPATVTASSSSSSSSLSLARCAATGGPRGAELFLAQGLRGHTQARTRARSRTRT